MVQAECFLIQLLHLTNALIDGVQQEVLNGMAEEYAIIPTDVAMRVYVQLKFLLKKQLPSISKVQPRLSGELPEQASIHILTQKLLDITLGRLMRASIRSRMSKM